MFAMSCAFSFSVLLRTRGSQILYVDSLVWESSGLCGVGVGDPICACVAPSLLSAMEQLKGYIHRGLELRHPGKQSSLLERQLQIQDFLHSQENIYSVWVDFRPNVTHFGGTFFFSYKLVFGCRIKLQFSHSVNTRCLV